MSDTQEIKDKIDVVDLVGEYVTLKPAGINHKGLCPFHNEKSPSFMVNRDRQSWHCFGCNKGGDIFSFVQEIEGLEFVEALKMLADRAGVTLSRQPSGETSSQKNRLKDIHADAAHFYHYLLLKMPQSEEARLYLRGRGLSQDTIEQWQIGFVPDQWDLLTKYLLKKGHSIDDLVASGLTIQKEGARPGASQGHYDRFRGRVMFPIRDVHGSVVGFTGRVLVETEKSGGKYVNSPQTALFDKSSLVFGLDKAKRQIRKLDMIVLVEGQMDVIAAHQAGFTNVVATSGTSLTIETDREKPLVEKMRKQIGLLRRYSTNISMCFDADEAGISAAKKGIFLALEAGMHVRVIQIPEGAGKDPDECIKKNPEIWKHAVQEATDVIAWYIDQACLRHDTTSPYGKQAIVDEVLPVIAAISFAVERDHWMRQLASRIGVEMSVLREDLKRLSQQPPGPQKQPEKKHEPKKAQPSLSQSKIALLQERYIGFLLRFFEGLQPLDAEVEKAFQGSQWLPLYKEISSQYNGENQQLDKDCVRNAAQQESEEDIIDVLLMKGELDFSHISVSEVHAEQASLERLLLSEWKTERRKDLGKKIAAAEQAGDSEQLRSLLEEFHVL